MTPSKEEIAVLVERVRGLKGPDREVDGAIEVEARRQDAYRAGLDDNSRAKWKHNGCTVFDGNTGYDAPRFTGSLDAALALVERVQPSLVIKMTRIGDGSNLIQINEAWIGESGIEVVNDFYPFEPMPAAKAVVLVLLLSLQSQEPL